MHLTTSLLSSIAFLSIAIPSFQTAPNTSDTARIGSQDPGVVRLRIGGHLEGRLEPCGCAGGQIGGLSRRVSSQLLDRAAYDLLLEGGNLIHGGTVLDEYKLLTTTTILGDQRTPYDVVGLGPDDLSLPLDSLLPYLDFGLPFVGCDLVVEPTEEGLPPFPLRPFVDLEANDVSLRVTGFVGSTGIESEDAIYRVSLLEPQTAWSKAMDGVADSALRIAFVHNDTLIQEIAALDPKPHLLIVCTPTHAEPPAQLEVVDSVTVVQPGTRGRLMVDLHLRIDGDEVSVESYRPFPLDGEQRDEATEAAILQHRFDVADDDLLQEMANARPSPEGIDYVADESICAACHFQEVQIWKNSKHASAWKTLEDAEESEKYGWPVTEYPDCVSCHSVGYGEQSGFVDIEQTPTLASVRCQSCHGPASEHLAASDKTQGFTRDAKQSCQTCHDYEQSPDWDYRKRWPVIEHGPGR
ncbi:MAG: cytochrome c family protein [Planctomycetota bacterium]